MIDLDSLRPGDSSARFVSGHALLVVRLRPGALHTGRPLFLIVCQSCKRLVHDATTGPAFTIEEHVGASTEFVA